MSQLSDWISKACFASGLRSEPEFTVVLPTGQQLVAMTRIADLGAANGMLLFRSYDEVRDHAQSLLDAGYGYSVLDEPRADEKFDLESFREMFRDWGWAGKMGGSPDWMR